ncbi:hypothetical protein [Pseudoxanthomonas sp. Root630]|uniref:hypothetical protein n=1 Tax=Pseudoxanthomonas sp. Root630 TaxID=1736574 RepID=UPI0007033789|nr:hypothetical protein [Pseudoxanthomonas sp. Root630]KRA46320.1 hypothetical protein ASD72_03660 [Pseudoxanthomonas sp. Root630]
MRTRTTLLTAALIGSAWAATDTLAEPPTLSFEEAAVAAAGGGSTPAPDSRLASALRQEDCSILSSFIQGSGRMNVGGAMDPGRTIGTTGRLETTMTVASTGQTAYATCAGHNVILAQHVRATAPGGGTLSTEARLHTLIEEDGFEFGKPRSVRVRPDAPYLVAWRDANGIQHSVTYAAQADQAAAQSFLIPFAKRVAQRLAAGADLSPP